MPRIESLNALEILDSRGNPTVRCSCTLRGGAKGIADVPSGASTGVHEAVELRDGDPDRFGGKGCRKAVTHIRKEILETVQDADFADQSDLDRALQDCDGTENLGRLGANAVLAVSLAFARASAAARGTPLHKYFATLLPADLRKAGSFPLPTINLFSGGVHAGRQVAIQDVLIVPLPGSEFPEQLEAMHAIYAEAAAHGVTRYGMRSLTADEGGLAPPFPSSGSMLDAAMECAVGAGLRPGEEFSLAVDAAASHFHRNGFYDLDGAQLAPEQLIEVYADWTSAYPLYSLEDGLEEEDWDGWQQLRFRLRGETLVLGDDFLCTNPDRIRRAIRTDAADALLLKVNQIGTVTRALEALALARNAGWHVVASARSGETEDDWLADLAVGWRVDNIKVGSITQSERLSKYNRLLEIHAAMSGRTSFP